MRLIFLIVGLMMGLASQAALAADYWLAYEDRHQAQLVDLSSIDIISKRPTLTIRAVTYNVTTKPDSRGSYRNRTLNYIDCDRHTMVMIQAQILDNRGDQIISINAGQYENLYDSMTWMAVFPGTIAEEIEKLSCHVAYSHWNGQTNNSEIMAKVEILWPHVDDLKVYELVYLIKNQPKRRPKKAKSPPPQTKR